MTEKPFQTGPRVELWVRDPAPASVYDIQADICFRLQQLAQREIITEFTVRAWGGQITATAGDALEEVTRPVREKLAEFEEWASQNGHTLRPAVQQREVSSLVAEGTQDVTVPPIMCIAVYDDGTLQGVFPCSDGEHVHTVRDCLDRLETDPSGQLIAPTSNGNA